MKQYNLIGLNHDIGCILQCKQKRESLCDCLETHNEHGFLQVLSAKTGISEVMALSEIS